MRVRSSPYLEWVGDGKWAYDTAGMKLKSPADRPARVPGNQISGRPYYVRVHRGEVRWTKPLGSEDLDFVPVWQLGTPMHICWELLGIELPGLHERHAELLACCPRNSD